MSWDATNKTLTDPISLYDVAQAVGYTGSVHDLGWLIANGAINPFAVNKPYRGSSLRTDPRLTTQSQFSMLGLQVPYATTVAAFMALHGTGDMGAITPANGWAYLRPRGKGGGTGGVDEWYRIFDFLKMTSVGVFEHNAVGYHADAPNPFGTYYGPSPVAISGGNLTAQQKLPLRPATGGRPEYDMVISDLNGLNYATGAYYSGFPAATARLAYYGLLFVPVNSTTNEWDTSVAAKIIADTTMIDADADSSTGKITERGFETLAISYRLTAGQLNFRDMKYKVFPFLTPTNLGDQQPLTIQYSERNNTLANYMKLVPIPGAEPSYVTLYSDTIEVNVYSSGSATGGVGGVYTASIYVEVTNRTANDIVIPSGNDLYGPTLRLRTDNHAFAYPSGAGAPQSGEVFYSRTTRWDSSHPGGVADSTYNSLLSALAGATVPAGETVRFPSGSLLSFVDFESGHFIHVGFYYGNSFHSGNVVVRTPATANLETT